MASEALIEPFDKKSHSPSQALDVEIQKLHAKTWQVVVERDSLQGARERWVAPRAGLCCNCAIHWPAWVGTVICWR